jgi:hypothetical protein
VWSEGKVLSTQNFAVEAVGGGRANLVTLTKHDVSRLELLLEREAHHPHEIAVGDDASIAVGTETAEALEWFR